MKGGKGREGVGKGRKREGEKEGERERWYPHFLAQSDTYAF